jgi:hypothetical protein
VRREEGRRGLEETGSRAPTGRGRGGLAKGKGCRHKCQRVNQLD